MQDQDSTSFKSKSRPSEYKLAKMKNKVNAVSFCLPQDQQERDYETFEEFEDDLAQTIEK